MFRYTARAVVLMFALGGGLLIGNPANAADDACVPVRAMINNYNALPKLRFRQDVVNDGTGWSSTPASRAERWRIYGSPALSTWSACASVASLIAVSRFMSYFPSGLGALTAPAGAAIPSY